MGYVSGPANIRKIGGRIMGDGLGNDLRVTRKVPVLSTKYNQGLPLHAIDYSFLNGGYWETPEIGGKFNGVSEIGSTTDPNGFAFITAKGLNRYQAGQPGYLNETLAFLGIEEADGDFECLAGVFLRGLVVDAEFDQIDNAICWGYIWDGVSAAKRVFRVYKGGVIIKETDAPDWKGDVTFDRYVKDNLHIFELDYAYLGIYPPKLSIYDEDVSEMRNLHTQKFERDTTYVNDPNMTVGVYIKNNGNTSNIRVRNGSLQLGNYAERQAPDPSGRELIDEIDRASVALGDDTFIAAYSIPTKINMYSKIDSTMLPTLSEYKNTIANQLLSVETFGVHQSSNKRAVLNFYFINAADVTGGTFLPINEGVNVLHRSDVQPTYNLADATKFARINVLNGVISEKDVKLKEILLRPDIIALVTMTSDVIVTGLNVLLDTIDQF